MWVIEEIGHFVHFPCFPCFFSSIILHLKSQSWIPIWEISIETNMFKFLKGVVAGSGTGVKDLPYNIGEPYSSAWGSWTHSTGTSKVFFLLFFFNFLLFDPILCLNYCFYQLFCNFELVFVFGSNIEGFVFVGIVCWSDLTYFIAWVSSYWFHDVPFCFV